MSTMTPLPAGVREPAPRLVAHGPAEALRRITAPTPSPWFWVALWIAAAVAGVAAVIPLLFGVGPPMELSDVLHSLSGSSFAACGLIAWHRRPDSAVGPLLTITGFGVLVPEILVQVHSALPLTLVALFGELWIMGYAALILSFVTGGRLASRVDVVIVQAYFVALFVFQVAILLFRPDEHNLLRLWPDAGVAETLTRIQFGLLTVTALSVVAVVGARWRAASRPRRRALLPSLGGCLSAVLYAANLITLLAGAPSLLLMDVLNGALLALPAAFVWGLLRSRLARAGLADLFRGLVTLRGAALEEGLAKALGDPALVLAHPVPGSRAHVDGRGRPVAVPEPSGDRAAALVERDGHKLGMLVYDTSLDEDPELVSAVAATAAVALEDARLQEEARVRLAELRASRERIVTASDAERRRLERNLHDGAQQRIVSVALQLRMLQSRMGSDPTLADELKAAGDELSQSLEELRELARGIHPAVLNHGLKAALDSLATRAAVPTAVAYDGPERLAAPVELAAYFVACEALANVGKYARATCARVRVSHGDGVARIEVADDGIGGADETAGSGLVGLADRVAALDGNLRILSPPGEGTVVTAELPCAS